MKGQPMILADLAFNHNGDPELARRLVELAASQAGADGVVARVGSEGESRYELPIQAWASLREGSRGELSWFVAPSDLESFQRGLPLQPDGFLLSTSAASDRPLLREITDETTGRLIVSAAGLNREEAIRLRDRCSDRLVLLWESSGEPETPWRIIPVLKRLGFSVAYSDALPNWTEALKAAALGAEVIVKRLADDRRTQGPTQGGSLRPGEFRELAEEFRSLLQGLKEDERDDSWPIFDGDYLEAWKGLVAARRLPKGHVLRQEDLKATPPLKGVTSSQIDFVVGKSLLYEVNPEDPITLGILDL